MERNFQNHWRKVPKRNTLSRSKFSNLTYLVALWSKRPNQNFRQWAAKTDKKSWGETLRTTAVKFRSEILSPGQNLRSILLRCDHGSNFQNFDQEGLQTFTPMALKVSLMNFLPNLDVYRQKLRIGLFEQPAARLGSDILRCEQIGQISKFFNWIEYFEFPSRIFYPF